MLLPPTATFSPVSCYATPCTPLICGSSIPSTPGLPPGQLYGHSRAEIKLFECRAWPSINATDEDDGPAFKRHRIHVNGCQAPSAASATAATVVTVVPQPSFDLNKVPAFGPRAYPYTSLGFYGDPSPLHLRDNAPCLARLSMRQQSHAQLLQPQQQPQQQRPQQPHYLQQRSAAETWPTGEWPPDAVSGGHAPDARDAALGCLVYPATLGSLRGTGADATSGRTCQSWDSRAPQSPKPPAKQQQQQQQRQVSLLGQWNRHHEAWTQPQQPQNLELQLLLTVQNATSQHYGVEPRLGLAAGGLMCPAARITGCGAAVPQLAHADQPQLLYQTHQQPPPPLQPPPPQQQRQLQARPHPHLRLTLRPLNCHLISSSAATGFAVTAAPELYQHPRHQKQQQQQQHQWPQWPPPALQPPLIPQQQPPIPQQLQQQQQQRQQQRRPCIPFFAPTTPPLDAFAPSECILLLCKALSMSEGTTGRLALHIWNRIRGMVRLLASVRPQAHSRHRQTAAAAAAAAASPSAAVATSATERVYSVAAVWVAAKLEETRREVPTVHTLAAVGRTLPSVLIAAELRVLQWCEWAPYLGFVPDDSHLLIDL